MSRLSPVVTAAVVGCLCILAAVMGPRQAATSSVPIAGTLYSVTTDSMTAINDGSQPASVPYPTLSLPPELRISVDPAARAALPPGRDEFLVRFIAPESSTFTLTLGRRSAASVNPTSARPLKPRPIPAPVVAAVPVPVEAPAPPPRPKAAQPRNFTEFDEALRGSSTAQAINQRLKRVGVTFRITHVGRVGDRGVVRYAVANEEAPDFFLSVVNVSAAGKPVLSENAGPYACKSGEEIFGVVHFAPAAVVGKRIAVELIQSGGDRRRFSLPVSYPF
jgi:hypothetical protein